MSTVTKLTSPGPSVRVTSIDAFRGFVMLAMASGGLGLDAVADRMPEDLGWGFVGAQVQHVAWRGCVLWDLIQPSFIFLVGAAMSFSDRNRQARGESWNRRFGHAIVRSCILITLGVFLASNGSKQTEWTFTNVLAQIGLGYTLVFLLVDASNAQIIGAITSILGLYWIAFALYPGPPTDLPLIQIGSSPAWEPMTGFFTHWEKNVNVAAAFDRWFLNLFPRPDGKPFLFNAGGYTTLNFIPSMATMLLGVLAGRYLQSPATRSSKARSLFFAGVVGIVAGILLDSFACPSIKRIWTPTWVIYSAGWVAIALSVFVAAFDGPKGPRLAFPFIVVGANSIAIYLMAQLIKPWVRSTIRAHATTALYSVEKWIGRPLLLKVEPTGTLFSGGFGPILDSAAVLMILWLICAWMYRRKIFIRV